MLLQQLTPALWIELRWIGAIHEVDQDIQELLGLVQLRKVSGVRKDLQATARHLLMGSEPMSHRNYGVVLAPDQQEGNMTRKVQPV